MGGSLTKNRAFTLVASLVVAPLAGWLLADRLPAVAASGWLTCFLTVLVFVLAGLPFINAFRSSGTDYFQPIFLVSLLYGLYFGLRTIYAFYRPELVTHQEVFDISLLNQALSCVVVGFALLLAAYYSPIGRKLARSAWPMGLQREWPVKGLLAKLIILYSVGFVVRWLAIEAGVTDIVRLPHSYPLMSYSEVHAAGRDYLANFQEYTRYALLALMLAGIYRSSKTAGACLLGLWSLELLFVLPTTSKRTFLVLALMFSLWSNYRRRRLVPDRYLLIGLLGAFVVFPWVNTYRTVYAQRYTYLRSAKAIPGAGMETWRRLSSMSASEYFMYSIDAFFGRAHGIDSMCLVLRYTPSVHEFLNGKDYLYIVPAGLIPRAIWKNKPFFESEEVFELYYWRGDLHGPLGANPGPTMIGDFYMNFGLPGIIVGMFGLGLLYRFLYELLVVRTGASSPGLMFYFATLLPLLQIEASILNLSVALKKIIYLAIFHWFVKEKRASV